MHFIFCPPSPLQFGHNCTVPITTAKWLELCGGLITGLSTKLLAMPRRPCISATHKRDSYRGERFLAAPKPTCSWYCCCISERRPSTPSLSYIPHMHKAFRSPFPCGLPGTVKNAHTERNTQRKLLCIYFTKLQQKSKNHILHEVSMRSQGCAQIMW